jgi:hypothetical protein
MQALAMQLLKNKQGYSYCCGYLDVPNKYAYLKGNAAKKTLQEDHGASQLSGTEGENAEEGVGDLSGVVTLGSKPKHTAPVTVATQQPRKKKKATNSTNQAMNAWAHSTARGKGKKKVSEVEVEVELKDEDEDVDKTQDSNVNVNNQSEDGADVADPEEFK